MNNDHIQYYHIDKTQLMGLAWSFFFKPDFWLSNVGSMPHFYHWILQHRQGQMFIILLSSFLGSSYMHEEGHMLPHHKYHGSFRCYVTLCCYHFSCIVHCQLVLITATFPIICQVLIKCPCNNCMLFLSCPMMIVL